MRFCVTKATKLSQFITRNHKLNINKVFMCFRCTFLRQIGIRSKCLINNAIYFFLTILMY
ncbi:Uncharacterised protein [Klebsiella pneumoniae]|nr:Uncharacterised protein [Klebsiella pneumoniae]